MADLIRGDARTLTLRATYHGVETRAPLGVPTWSISDSTVGSVTPIAEDGMRAKFFALGGGTCEVSVVLGDLIAKRTFTVLGEADALEILVEGEIVDAAPGTGTVILLEPLGRLFPADNWWNLDISTAPVDRRSDTIIAFLGGAGQSLRADCGPDTGLPYFTVLNVPLVPVKFDYADESDAGFKLENGYPIPEIVKTDARYIEGSEPGGTVTDSDGHLLILDKGRNCLYELFETRWTGTAWTAASGAIWDLSENGRRPDGWVSADAAGLAVLPGLMRPDEVYSSSPITHAHRFMAPNGDGTYVWPASHRIPAGVSAAGPPLGARLRLKATVDISVLPAPAQKIAAAMKRYGLILADHGSSMFISGAKSPAWTDDFIAGFKQLHASDFEVVQLGWHF